MRNLPVPPRPVPPSPAPRALLSRLGRDRTANTLVIMAMALVPISALAGSAVDMGRLYVVKSRLQQACDAGVLAGRKFMSTTSTSTTLDANAVAQANTFFKNNFQQGWLDTGAPSFTPRKTADQQVAGVASVKVPMTIMKMFAASDVTINVACKARYDIADTDIVFVLDTTGSMACRPEHDEAQCNSYVNANPAVAYTRPASDSYATAGYGGTTSYAVPESSAGSRIAALRQAVKDFYATMDASVDANTRIRYGFVTYTSTVNAGAAIMAMSPAYMMGGLTSGETADYETRVVTGEYEITDLRQVQQVNAGYNSCTNAASSRDPAATNANAYPFRTTDGRATRVDYVWSDSRCYKVTRTMGPVWTYRQAQLDVSKYITGAATQDPTKAIAATTRWDGCIEERQTQAATTSFTSASFDLDPSLKPSSAAATRWKPMWPDVTWARWNYGSTNEQSTNGDNMPSESPPVNAGAENRRRSGFYSCGKPIRRLEEMSAAQVAAYVDAVDFKALGGTYHDTGMIWGTRLLAPNGIFAADNVGRSGQTNPRKVIVFLTDGDMSPNQNLYGLYGIEYYDRRVSGGSFGQLKAYHNARFLYECDQARQLGIDVWTVAIGLDSTPELTRCARVESQALATTSGSGLSSIFQQIAKQVAMLRIDQ